MNGDGLSSVSGIIASLVVCVGGMLRAGESLPAPPRAEEPLVTDVQARLAEAQAIWNRAQALRVAGKLIEAVATVEKGLVIQRQVFGDTNESVATWLQFLAELYEARDDFPAAESARRQVLESRMKQFGEQHWRTVDARLALAQAGRLMAFDAAQRGRLREADRLVNRAGELHERGQYRQALEPARGALEVREQLLGEQHPDTASSVNTLGLLHMLLGDYAQAEGLYRRSLQICQQVLGLEHPGTASSLQNLAGLYQRTGDYAQAEKLYRQSLDIRRKVVGLQHPDTATSLAGLAILYDLMGDYVQAESLYRESLDVRKKVLGPEHPRTATSLNNLGYFYQGQGNYAQAEPLFRQALELRRKLLGGNHPNTAASLYALGTLYQQMGDNAQAESLHRQALEIRRQVLGDKHSDVAFSLNALAGLYRRTGDNGKAESLYTQSLESVQKALGPQHPTVAAALNNLAYFYHVTGHYAQAERLYRQSLEITQQALGPQNPDVGIRLNNLAGLYDCQGEYAKAAPLYRQSLEITQQALGSRHPNTVLRLNNLAMCYYSIGDYAKAEPLCRQAMAVARGNLELAAAVQSQRQQLTMLQSLRYPLDAYLSLASTSGQYGDVAYQHVLRWKGAVWMRQNAARAVVDQPELGATYRELQATTGRLATAILAAPDLKQQAAWNRQIGELTERKERLEAELARQSGAFRAARQEPAVADLRASLPSDFALVDYLEYTHYTPSTKDKPGHGTFERRLLAFVVRPEREPALVSLGPMRTVIEAVSQWRDTYGWSPASRQAGQRLREQVWDPLQLHLAGVKAVLLSPDGALGRFPFAALPGKEPGQYLLQERALAVLPVAQALPALRQDRKGPRPDRNLLLIGGVDYEAPPGPADGARPQRTFGRRAERGAEWRSFASLDGTLGELATIAKMYQDAFGADGLTTLRRGEPSKARFTQEAPRHLYLHLATHGFFSPPSLGSALSGSDEREGARATDSPPTTVHVGRSPGLLSGVALAGANRQPAAGEDDGILTAEEVQNLDLRGVELAVLSACETGLGAVAGGEGLLGLQRAFQVAGVRTTVASLWKVDDVQTRALMERFYQNVWEKDMSKLEALREAQLWMLREGQRGLVRQQPIDTPAHPGVSPYYWAAFQLSGDWR